MCGKAITIKHYFIEDTKFYAIPERAESTVTVLWIG